MIAGPFADSPPHETAWLRLMVTSRHEASHRIFQERPEILGPVFGLLGVRPERNGENS
ncbi:hypothetical protein [Streptomyces sp. G5(2025)]|uniref:hypothetical protein n=1 Tax=Streptomyces sp. G5(2025) TaxID=3406628 RepID=UPI003C2E4CC0